MSDLSSSRVVIRTRPTRQPQRPTESERGGHTALTAARQAKIVEAIRRGAFAETAARAAGIDYRTYRRWYVDGEDKADPATGEVVRAPEPYRQFRQAMEAAEAALEEEASNIAYQGAVAQSSARSPSPAGMLAFMARRFRRRWADTQQVEVSGPEGAPINIEPQEDRLAGLLEGLARAGKVTLPSPVTPGGNERDVVAVERLTPR